MAMRFSHQLMRCSRPRQPRRSSMNCWPVLGAMSYLQVRGKKRVACLRLGKQLVPSGCGRFLSLTSTSFHMTPLVMRLHICLVCAWQNSHHSCFPMDERRLPNCSLPPMAQTHTGTMRWLPLTSPPRCCSVCLILPRHRPPRHLSH